MQGTASGFAAAESTPPHHRLDMSNSLSTLEMLNVTEEGVALSAVTRAESDGVLQSPSTCSPGWLFCLPHGARTKTPPRVSLGVLSERRPKVEFACPGGACSAVRQAGPERGRQAEPGRDQEGMYNKSAAGITYIHR